MFSPIVWLDTNHKVHDILFSNLTCGCFWELFQEFSDQWCVWRVWIFGEFSRFWRSEQPWRCTRESRLRRWDWDQQRQRRGGFQEDQWCWGKRWWNQTCREQQSTWKHDSFIFDCVHELHSTWQYTPEKTIQQRWPRQHGRSSFLCRPRLPGMKYN